MPEITYNGRAYPLAPGESVLACLMRHGAAIPSSCQAGACQSCLMRAIEGKPPEKAQVGLKESLRRQGYFLACIARPETDLAIALPDEAALQVPAVVADRAMLSADVLRLRLRAEAPLACAGGQFVSIVRPDGLIRPYSVASLPDVDGYLELHVRRTPNGQMSNWLFDEVRVGDRVQIRGPGGDCFYLTESPQPPLLLAGTGTGLAPLVAILRDALRHGHRAPILLVHGALNLDGFYLVEMLQDLAAVHENVTYLRCMPDGLPGEGLEIGAFEEIVLRRVTNPADWRMYLCGHPDLVFGLRRRLFLAGASLKRIHSDAFLSAPQAPATVKSNE